MADLVKHYRTLVGIAKTWALKTLPGWSDESHQDLIRRAGGKRVDGRFSATTLTLAQLHVALADYEARGWPRKPYFADKPKAGGRGRQMAERREVPPQVAQLLRLWGLLAKAGKVQDGGRAALLAWCGRQTGGETPPNFDALAVAERMQLIEALKAWLARE